MAVIIHDCLQGSPEWHALRDKLYTGTGADKLLAHSAAVKIVDGVASAYALTEMSGFGGNFHTRRGHVLEDEALELYAAITGHTISRPGFVTNTKYPGCGYSPDGHDDTIAVPLEVKAFNEVKHLRIYNGDVPLKTEAQTRFGQFVWEKRLSRLLIYNPRFAKKIIDGMPNPNYDPAKALKIIDIRWNRAINNNFKLKLTGRVMV